MASPGRAGLPLDWLCSKAQCRGDNWGRWGADDERGAVNLLTPEVVLEALRRPTTGKVYQLGIELKRDAPVGGNRIAPLHFMTQDGGDFAALNRTDWGTADDYMVLATQGTSHVDGLAHVWSGGKLYNDFPFTDVRSSGAQRLGTSWTSRNFATPTTST